LIFGNNDEPPKDLNMMWVKLEIKTKFHSLFIFFRFNVTKKDRLRALAKGLSKLFWKCGEQSEATVAIPTNKAYFPPSGKYRTDGFTETVIILKQ
jgi:hypothetical protein